MNCWAIYIKTKKAIEPQMMNRPMKGSGPKPSPSPFPFEEQLKEARTSDSNCGISFVSVSSTIDAETLEASSDPFAIA